MYMYMYIYMYKTVFKVGDFFCNTYDFVVSVRSLNKPQGVKTKLDLWSCPWWKVITGICRNLHCKNLALTEPSGDFCPGKATDLHLVSPWYDFIEAAGIKRNYHAGA